MDHFASPLLLVILSFPCLLLPTSGASQSPWLYSDYASLRAFQASVVTSLAWPNHTDYCGWFGIRCNPDGFVESVHLPSLGLSGTLSPRLFDLSALCTLDLSNNSLSGLVPSNLRNLSSLHTLDLSHNPLLRGHFPSHLPPNIRILDLSHCSLYGPIRGAFSNLSSLKEIHTSHNFFTSFAPCSISSIPRLQILDASYNLINGSMAESLFNCTQLRELSLAYNHMEGVIPEQVGQASSLEVLDLRGNYFTGAIPTGIQKCMKLKQIWLDDNFLSYSSAEDIGQLRALTVLSLSNNGLAGLFPSGILNCTSMMVLSLSRNKLYGEIPAALGNLSGLQVLLLNDNEFSGYVPRGIARVGKLKILDVSNNRLVGSFFQEVGDMVCVTNMGSSDSCRRQDQISHQVDLDLESSSCSWVHCTWLSNKKQCQLDLSSGGLTWQVLAHLQTHNLLCVGKLGRLPQDRRLDFHGRNSLTERGVHRERLLKERVVLTPLTTGMITGAGVFVAVLLVGLVILCCFRLRRMVFVRKFLSPAKLPSLRRFQRESSRVFDSGLESISMRVLVKLTDDFDKTRIIGDGGFGLVFSATLQDGRSVAVKKLSMDGLQGRREFEAEMDTLGMIKHENLVELLAYCKLGDERVLVYEFVENGSLDTWLHERQDGPVTLHWQRRLNISKGSARGLAYLHHDCDPHVIHRDIKSSNILLGKNFEPKLADFGLARNINPLVSHVSTPGAGTLGYMAPEYAHTTIATLKADVYSFGMLMLELAIRRRPNVPVKERNCRTMARWACTVVEEGNVLELLDPFLKKKQPPLDQVISYFSIASDCVNENPAERPMMREVSERLSLIGIS